MLLRPPALSCHSAFFFKERDSKDTTPEEPLKCTRQNQHDHKYKTTARTERCPSASSFCAHHYLPFSLCLLPRLPSTAAPSTLYSLCPGTQSFLEPLAIGLQGQRWKAGWLGEEEPAEAIFCGFVSIVQSRFSAVAGLSCRSRFRFLRLAERSDKLQLKLVHKP